MTIDTEKTKLAVDMLKIVAEIANKGKSDLSFRKFLKLQEVLLKVQSEILETHKIIENLEIENFRLKKRMMDAGLVC